MVMDAVPPPRRPQPTQPVILDQRCAGCGAPHLAVAGTPDAECRYCGGLWTTRPGLAEIHAAMLNSGLTSRQQIIDEMGYSPTKPD